MSISTALEVSTLLIKNSYQGAFQGAKTGTFVGAGLLATVLSAGLIQSTFERTARFIGMEPRWPMNLEEDCQLEQFKTTQVCTEKPAFDSFTAFSIFIVGGSIATGAVIGAVHGAAKTIGIIPSAR